MPGGLLHLNFSKFSNIHEITRERLLPNIRCCSKSLATALCIKSNYCGKPVEAFALTFGELTVLRGHPLSTYVKFSEKLTFLPCQGGWGGWGGGEMLVFPKILRTYLMDGSLSVIRTQMLLKVLYISYIFFRISWFIIYTLSITCGIQE